MKNWLVGNRYCKLCDKLAVQAICAYSQMYNPIREDIVGSINKVMIDSLNKVVENVAQAIDKA